VPFSYTACAVWKTGTQAPDGFRKHLRHRSGIGSRRDSDGQGDALEQGEVDVNVKPLGLEAGKAVGDGPEGLAYCVEVVEVFAQAEVGQVVGAQFIAQEGGEFLVLF
jgi:hypothetical protein